MTTAELMVVQKYVVHYILCFLVEELVLGEFVLSARHSNTKKSRVLLAHTGVAPAVALVVYRYISREGHATLDIICSKHRSVRNKQTYDFDNFFPSDWVIRHVEG